VVVEFAPISATVIPADQYLNVATVLPAREGTEADGQT
jgi:hypothetical protein